MVLSFGIALYEDFRIEGKATIRARLSRLVKRVWMRSPEPPALLWYVCRVSHHGAGDGGWTYLPSSILRIPRGFASCSSGGSAVSGKF